MNAKKITKIILLLFLFLIIGATAPKKAEAADISKVGGSIAASNNADGTHNVTATIYYSGNAADDFSDLTFFIHSDPGDVLCRMPPSSNPGSATVDINEPNCDFRGVAAAGSRIKLSLFAHRENNIPFGNDGCGIGGDECSPLLGSTWVDLLIGAANDQYIISATPRGGGLYDILFGGDNQSSCPYSMFLWECKYRLRVVGREGPLNVWDRPTTGYSCDGGLEGWRVDNFAQKIFTGPILCDFGGISGVDYVDLAIYLGDSGNFGNAISTFGINLSSSDAYIKSKSFIAGDTPNDIGVTVEFFPSAVGGTYNLKLVDSSNNASGNCSVFNAVLLGTNEQYTVCDFSYANPSATYWIVLLDPSGTEIDRELLGLEAVPVAGSGGVCSCISLATGCSINAAPATACWFGYVPTMMPISCIPPPLSSCSCSCVFTPASSGFPLPGLSFAMEDFQKWTSKAQQYLIAIGVVSSIFIVPYIGVLLASGNEESIKKGSEWFQSWAFGLLLLLLSGLILRVVGSDILGL